MTEDSTTNSTTDQRDVVHLEAMRASRQRHDIDRIEHYWQETRGARLVPSRIDIDPRGLTGVLSNAFILERIAPGLARFRIAGSHLTDLMGLDVKGMPLSTVFLPEARRTLSDALQATFEDPSIVRMRLTAESGFGRPDLSGHMVLLPLRSDLGEISRVLGGISMHGEIGRGPRRLSITAETREGLTGTGHAGDVPQAPVAPRTKPPSRAATPPRRPVSPGKPHLQLVIDNAK